MKHGVKYFSGMTNSRLVLLGGRVFTSDPDQPWVEAVVVDGDSIAYAGMADEARRIAGTDEGRDELPRQLSRETPAGEEGPRPSPPSPRRDQGRVQPT